MNLEIAEKFNGLSTPKKVFVIGGAGIGLYFLYKNLNRGGGSVVSAAQYTGDLSQGLASGSSGGSGGTATTSGTSADYTTVTDQLTDISSQFNDYKTNTDSVLNTLTDTVTAAENENAFLTALTETPSIYADNVDDAQQFNKIVSGINSSVSSGTFTSAQGAKATSYIAGLGNNGIKSDGTAQTANVTIGMNSSTVNSELARANAVLQNRTAAGLDTSAQTFYINQLKSIGA